MAKALKNTVSYSYSSTVAAASADGIRTASSRLGWTERRDHILARLGYRRSGHRVDPGLYAMGNPDRESPVFVTANYTLSFDALRSALAGRDGYILVLDTRGINVWCAAGKGTFGTDELVGRIQAAGLEGVVSHRSLILPQLGAPGVAAHEVKKRTGFRIEYGPIRASELPSYMEHHKATPEMRKVRFTLTDRLVLIPIELVHTFMPMLLVATVLYLAGGWLPALAAIASILGGVVLFPILLPSLATCNFSTKGLVLGLLIALPFALAASLGRFDEVWWLRVLVAICYLLPLPSVTAFIALNFTGATPFPSRTGVRREIFRYIPLMAWLFGLGALVNLAVILISLFGG